MKTLTLVRHAKSSWKEPGLSDRERPLNARGKRDAPVMGRRIRAHGIRPSLIITSPALRAWKTAQVVAREIGYPAEFLQREEKLYLASLDELLDVVAAQDDGFNHLMVVSHNPGLTDFCNFLSPGVTNNMQTAAVLSVEIDRDTWQLYDRPRTRLVVYDYPKLNH